MCGPPGACRVRAHPDDTRRAYPDNVFVRAGILLVDDHEGFRALARVMLEADGLLVLGEAADGATAVAAAAALRPGVVLLDIHLPDMDGFAVAERMSCLPSPPTVVLISSRPIADVRLRLAASPVAGFLEKNRLSAAALEAIAG